MCVGGGTRKIEVRKLDWTADSKVGSKNNIKHKPGGGNVQVSEPAKGNYYVHVYVHFESSESFFSKRKTENRSRRGPRSRSSPKDPSW